MTSYDPQLPVKTLSLQPTQQCNAACEHCGTFSGPDVKVRLGNELAEDVIRQAADAGYNDVVFTGGEPTLSGRWLFTAIELTKSLGLTARLVTNGWWARSEESAARITTKLAAAGLDEINFSTGDQHARFVEAESIVRGVCAAVKQGLKVTLLVEVVKTRTVTRATFEAHPQIVALRDSYPSEALSIYESPWMPLNPETISAYPPGVAINGANIGKRSGCDSVIQTTTISPDGTIGACCGIGMRLVPELQLGNIADTSLAKASRKAESDPLKQWIRAEGPERILARAAALDAGIQWENMYAHRCQACLRMYKDPQVQTVLREHYPEMFVTPIAE